MNEKLTRITRMNTDKICALINEKLEIANNLLTELEVLVDAETYPFESIYEKNKRLSFIKGNIAGLKEAYYASTGTYYKGE